MREYNKPMPNPTTEKILREGDCPPASCSPFSLLMDQIENMKKKSDLYHAEAEEDEEFNEAEKHLRVSSVLKELHRLGKCFEQNNQNHPQR